MTRPTVNGRSGSKARAGARTLNLLAAPLNARILRALCSGPKQQADLQRESGHPAQTTLRAQLKRLVDAGAVEKRRRNRFPGVLEYSLSESGTQLLSVADIVDRWLESSTEQSLELGKPTAKAAVKALTEGWSTTMLRALAARPLTLTELDKTIPSINYPSLERRLAAMRLSGLIETRSGKGRGTPYSVTDWARLGVGPILAAIRWERDSAVIGVPPPTKLDIETAFLLSVGLLTLPADSTGSCRLAVELRNSRGASLVGVKIEIRNGAPRSQTTRLDGDTDAWVAGPLSAWLYAVLDRDISGLEFGGSGKLGRAVVHALYGTIFPLPVPHP